MQGNSGTEHKSHVGQVYFYATNPGKKFLIDTKRKSPFIELFVGIVWPVQGQGKTRTASAAGGEVNTEIPAFFVCKIRFKLFAGTFTKLKHEKASTGLTVVLCYHLAIFSNMTCFNFCQ